MPALVQLLAAGVNGATNGSATFVLRGTASSAASVLYNDFEGTAQPGTNVITLDANGAAEVYCDAYCDITLKTSAGVTLRTVTIGNSATTVEVVSDSFTGTDYSGSPTAVNEPITLAAVLNKWDNSAGADDWKILVNGVAVNLSAAFAGVAGLVFNVKDPTYGAVGDGVTDDTTAIGLAITAAAAVGGIVWFPATSAFYSTTALPISSANVTLMGAGPRSSIIKASTTSDAGISFTDNTADTWKRMIGLGLIGTGANANALFQFENGQNVYVDNCEFVATTYTGHCIRRSSTSGFTFANFSNCKVTVGSGCDSAFFNASNDAQVSFKITNCHITVPASFVGAVISGPDFNMSGTVIDASLVTSGTYYHVASSSNQQAGRYLGRFTHNTFIDGGSSGICFELTSIATNSVFTEDGNTFTGFTAPTAFSSADKIYNVSHAVHVATRITLGSRRGRTLEVNLASTGAITASCFSSYETVFVNYTGAGNLTINAPVTIMVSGSSLYMSLLNASGSARDIIWNMGVSESSINATTDNGAASTDVTASPSDTETVYSIGHFVHNGQSSHPYFVLTTHVED